MTTGLLYIKVLLPLKLKWIPTYSTSEPLETGRRVNVMFAHRQYSGVVMGVDPNPDTHSSRIQPILEADDSLPPVSMQELRFWQFISTYYLCTLGEVCKAAYPSHLLAAEKSAASGVARLRTRLEKTEADLLGRHGPKVQERLKLQAEALRSMIRSEEAEPAAPVACPAPGVPVLLQSGSRTEEYAKAMRSCLDKGLQVLVLTPEIAFCNNLQGKLAALGFDDMHIVNSARTPAEKRNAAHAARSGKAAVFLGTRSAVFLPFRNLGLVIIDQEQDSSYKQTEPAPRYNGRDAAIALAGIHSARVILGSACPSLESTYNSLLGRYQLMQGSSNARYSIIDISDEKRKNGMNGSFSVKLIQAIRSWKGPVTLIRAWEKEEELEKEACILFPEKEISISTLAGLKADGCPDGAMIAVMQADALVSRDDFRCDEKSTQLAHLLCTLCAKLVIQTASASRFKEGDMAAALMPERKEFGFPPYTRLVDIHRQGSAEVQERMFLKKDQDLHRKKEEIYNSLGKDCFADVDPV